MTTPTKRKLVLEDIYRRKTYGMTTVGQQRNFMLEWMMYNSTNRYKHK